MKAEEIIGALFALVLGCLLLFTLISAPLVFVLTDIFHLPKSEAEHYSYSLAIILIVAAPFVWLIVKNLTIPEKGQRALKRKLAKLEGKLTKLKEATNENKIAESTINYLIQTYFPEGISDDLRSAVMDAVLHLVYSETLLALPQVNWQRHLSYADIQERISL